MESLLVVALHLVFGEMLKVTVQLAKNHGKFETLLKRLKKTLNRIQPIIDDIKKSREQLNYSEEEIKEFTNCLTKGKKLVLKCSEIKSWNLLEKYVYAYKLIRLDKDLLRIFQIDVPAKLLSDKKTLLVEIGVLKKKLDVLINVARGVKRLCGVLDLKVLIDGLKHGLLNDDTCIVLILAPGGNSVEMICHDKEKKGNLQICNAPILAKRQSRSKPKENKRIPSKGEEKITSYRAQTRRVNKKRQLELQPNITTPPIGQFK